MKRTVLKFQNVSVVYANGFCAVRDVNFEIAAGECLAIVGESGSGKTTIARAALGLLPKGATVKGSIRIGDAEIVGASEPALRNLRGLVAGFVAQEPFSSFNPLTKIYHHIGEAWLVHAQKPPHDFIIESLENFGIARAEEASQNYPHEWSGGMLQRATIVAAKAHQPKIIIADEPTSALDRNRADEILTHLREANSAVLLVSHDVARAAKYANRIAVCYRGEIVEIGDARQIIERPTHFYTKILLAAALPHNEISSENKFKDDGEIVLEAKNLQRFYRDNRETVRAVARADLCLRRGEIVGIYGDSGSGKSTLTRLLATIEKPTSGQIFLGGELASDGESGKVWSVKTRRGFVMPIFQDPLSSLDARWAIWRSVTEPLAAKHRREKHTKTERRKIAREILATVGLKEVNLEARPKELSVGQCQRICIARALVAEPALLVADEPTSALDSLIAQTILDLFVKIAEKGTAILIISHDEPMLRLICHRVLQVRDGVLLKSNR